MLMHMEATALGVALENTGQGRAPCRLSAAARVAPTSTLSSRRDPPPASWHADQQRTLCRVSVLDAMLGRTGQGRARPHQCLAPCVGQECSQAARGKQCAASVRRARIPLPREPALRNCAPVAALFHIPPPWVHPSLLLA